MAGYMGFAAKLLLGTSVLTSVGAGGYYVATNGLQLPSGSAASNSTEGNQPAAADAGELDAIASAWAPQTTPTPASTTAGKDEQFSPAARSAIVTIANAETGVAPAMPDDRYGIYPGMQAAIDVPPAGTTAEIDSTADSTTDAERAALVAQPIETEPVAAASVVPQPADSKKPVASEPTVVDPNAALPVARGQEPNEAAEATTLEAVDAVEAIAPAADASEADGVVEPQPLSIPADQRPLNSAAQRARDAFRDESAAATADPYGLPASAPPAADPAIANPFDEKPSAPTVGTNSAGTIEKLPEYSGDIENAADTLRSDAKAGSESPVSRYASPAGRSARAGVTSAADRFGAASTVPTLSTQHETAAAGSISDAASGGLAGGASDSAMINGTGRPGERALEGPQNSNLVIQKFAPGEIQVNKPAKFVVQVRNAGSHVAENVEVRDDIPQGTRLISTTPSAQAAGNQLMWQIGKLSAGEERTLEMQLMPLTEGEIGSVATVSYSAQASVKTRCTMPQLAIRMTAPEKVLIGQEQRVKIELHNPGTGDATNVMLFENVPQNLKHAAGPALEFEIGTLRPGETRELELQLVAEKAGKVVNTLVARADGNLQVQKQVEFEVIAPALAVEVNGPERRYLERPATYEVSIANPGTAPAYDVQIVTKLPKGMRFVRANNMGEYDASSHAVYWSLAELPEGEPGGTVELVLMPIETGQQLLEVETRAGQGLTDQAKQQIVVEGLAAIMFEVRDLEDPIEIGGETGYEIRVVNQGTKAATNVRIAVGLSAGMQVVSAEGETAHEVQGTALVFEPIAELAPKADSVFRVKARGTGAGDQRVKVEVMTDDLREPIRREESTRVFGDE